MKNKIVLLSTFILMTLSLTACDKYEKDVSYNTDLYGNYVYDFDMKSDEHDADHHIIENYTINMDNSFKYEYVKKSNIEGDKEEQYDGNVDILNISNDIDEITFDISNSYREEVLYKYKNMLGDFYETNVPKGKTFNLVLPMPTDNIYGYCPNRAYIFNEDGLSYLCSDIIDCDDLPEDHIGYNNYIRKGNVIYIQIPNYEISDYFIHAYITDGGLFYPQYYKEEK